MQQQQLREESFTLRSFAFQDQVQQKPASEQNSSELAAYRATASRPTALLRFCFRGSFRDKSFNLTFAAYSFDMDKLELSFWGLAQINKPDSLEKKEL